MPDLAAGRADRRAGPRSCPRRQQTCPPFRPRQHLPLRYFRPAPRRAPRARLTPDASAASSACLPTPRDSAGRAVLAMRHVNIPSAHQAAAGCTARGSSARRRPAADGPIVRGPPVAGRASGGSGRRPRRPAPPAVRPARQPPPPPMCPALPSASATRSVRPCSATPCSQTAQSDGPAATSAGRQHRSSASRFAQSARRRWR
mmetsp:Transcript_4403/g.13787  ORF Transcript_4403/g.13787 Transcript_4403/m.13787 type:complete len:202 (+) Transcript_4403:1818-2423(+)|eukprot:scaffold9266_cov110-Isochrysis_galbana.AAC.2